MTDKTLKAIGYARVSTSKQTYEIQTEKINKYCQDNKIYLAGIFKEIQSAVKERPEWEKVLNVIRQGEIDILIVHSSDRIARNLRHLLSIIDVCEQCKTDIIVIKEPMFSNLNTAQGKLIISVMGAVAEFERTLIRSRMDEGLERARLLGSKSGKPCHRPALVIDWDLYDSQHNMGITNKRISQNMGISLSVLQKYLAVRKKGE